MRDVDSEKSVCDENLDLDISYRQRMRSVVDAVLKDCRESSIDGEYNAPLPSRREVVQVLEDLTCLVLARTLEEENAGYSHLRRTGPGQEAGAPWPTHRGHLAGFWGEVPEHLAVRVTQPVAHRVSQSGEPIRSYSRASVICTVANSLAGSSSSTITVPSTSGASL